MAVVFLDTNIFLRHLLQDHPDYSPRATAFFARLERGDIQARIVETVVFETVFTLERTFKQAKSAIRDNLLPLLNIPAILLADKKRIEEAFNLYVVHNTSFADALHRVWMTRFGLTEILTFDRDFDKLAGITRTEP